MPKVHNYNHLSNGQAYDMTMCDDNIRDKDVIITGESILVLMEAWPVAIAGSTENVHTIKGEHQDLIQESIDLAMGLPEWESFSDKWVA
jgi:hypothetical protein